MNKKGVHPAGFYKTYPLVTWDLAEERWLGSCDRSDVLLASCLSCDWRSEGELVLAKPERRRIAEFITECQHWYECPGDPQVKFAWFEDLRNGRWPEDVPEMRWIRNVPED